MGTRFKYFPSSNDTKKWGLYLCDVGWQQTSQDTEYPVRQHPDGYYYTWKTGRLLSEYQICLTFSGEGIAEFVRGESIPLTSGTLFLVAPGQWHRCKPSEKSGWGSLWIGFNGKNAQAVVRSIFHAEKWSIRSIGKPKEFKYAAMRFIARVLKHGENKQYSTIGDLTLLLGRLADGEFDSDHQPASAVSIRNAQCEIARRYAEVIDFKALAESLGMSYDAFRHRFAAETNLSPLQFQLTERLRIAKNLIANTDLPMQEIAKRTGFASAAYFTRFFKESTKMPPREYRSAQSTEISS